MDINELKRDNDGNILLYITIYGDVAVTDDELKQIVKGAKLPEDFDSRKAAIEILRSKFPPGTTGIMSNWTIRRAAAGYYFEDFPRRHKLIDEDDSIAQLQF